MPISIPDRIFYQLINFDLLDDLTSLHTKYVPFAKTFIAKADGQDYSRMMYEEDIKKQKEANAQLTGHPIITTPIGPILPFIPALELSQLVSNSTLMPKHMLMLQLYNDKQEPLITESSSREDLRQLEAIQFIDPNLMVGAIDMNTSQIEFIKVPEWFIDKHLKKEGKS